MRRKLKIKSFSWLLIVVLFSVTLHGVFESAHAFEGHFSPTGEQVSAISAADGCPCCPVGDHDSDGCATCINCLCHTTIPLHPFYLSYSPILLHFQSWEPYRDLPEVYLPKFVPPQNLA